MVMTIGEAKKLYAEKGPEGLMPDLLWLEEAMLKTMKPFKVLQRDFKYEELSLGQAKERYKQLGHESVSYDYRKLFIDSRREIPMIEIVEPLNFLYGAHFVLGGIKEHKKKWFWREESSPLQILTNPGFDGLTEVFTDELINILDETGRKLRVISFGGRCPGTDRLARHENACVRYAQPNGNSLVTGYLRTDEKEIEFENIMQNDSVNSVKATLYTRLISGAHIDDRWDRLL